MDRRRWLTIGLVAVLAVVAFLLFRPDTLVTEVGADEPLEEAFPRQRRRWPRATTTTATPTTIADTTLATLDDHCVGWPGAALVWGVRRDRAQCHGDGRHL